MSGIVGNQAAHLAQVVFSSRRQRSKVATRSLFPVADRGHQELPAVLVHHLDGEQDVEHLGLPVGFGDQLEERFALVRANRADEVSARLQRHAQLVEIWASRSRWASSSRRKRSRRLTIFSSVILARIAS